MRQSRAGWLMVTVGAGLLSACADSPVAPVPQREKLALNAPGSGCGGGGLQMSTGALPSGSAPDVSLSWGWPIAGVTVRANFSGASFGLPFNIMQSMNFRPGTHPLPIPCLDAPGESYSVVAAEAIEVIPAPAGVDPDWWASLSPRERRALIKFAETYMRLYPAAYPSIGSVITTKFSEQIAGFKVRAKIRAMDFYGGTPQGELLAGAIYGCMLYRGYVSDPYSPFANSDVLEFATTMTTAFAEAQFASRPLWVLRFGRNGAFGAGLASADLSNMDCGSLIFRNVPGTIKVTDPYDEPSGSGGGSGGNDGNER